MNALVSQTILSANEDTGECRVTADVWLLNDPALNFPRRVSVFAVILPDDSQQVIGTKFRTALNTRCAAMGLPNPSTGVGIDVAKLW